MVKFQLNCEVIDSAQLKLIKKSQQLKGKSHTHRNLLNCSEGGLPKEEQINFLFLKDVIYLLYIRTL